MISDWIGHYHSRLDSPMARLSAELKLGVALVIIVVTVVVPPWWVGWFVGVSLLLSLVAIGSRIPLLFLLKRLGWVSPFFLCVGLVSSLLPAAGGGGWGGCRRCS
jgi:energy-coupling factor transporter transmembrane protein EcfT